MIRSAKAADLPAAEALLAGAGLTTEGVRDWIDRFLVAEEDGCIAGVAGLELYGDSALLRSVAVADAWRGTGLGRALVERALDAASAAGATDIFLLTTTAERYFPRFGFTAVPRSEVSAPVLASAEFRGACPASATVMCRRSGPPGAD
ncbi:MAG: arsenic resistance N-acetyltransferase ArsN2 [Bacillota bacterium]|jgi:amino-acid N-acetyltransferase